MLTKIKRVAIWLVVFSMIAAIAACQTSPPAAPAATTAAPATTAAAPAATTTAAPATTTTAKAAVTTAAATAAAGQKVINEELKKTAAGWLEIAKMAEPVVLPLADGSKTFTIYSGFPTSPARRECHR